MTAQDERFACVTSLGVDWPLVRQAINTDDWVLYPTKEAARGGVVPKVYPTREIAEEIAVLLYGNCYTMFAPGVSGDKPR
jgi:hypothetical protein